MELNEILARVNEILPPQPMVRFTVEKCGSPLSLFDSKLGGTPYFPKCMEYPRGKNNRFAGQPLTLLAQLNFAQLPHIPDFPEKGILQFFIAGDDMYGMSWGGADEMTAQENFRVIYHENIITDETQLLSPDEIPQYSGKDEVYLPFTGEYRLAAPEKGMRPANWCDHRFEAAFVKCYNEAADEPIRNIYELDETLSDQLYDNEELADNSDAFIGGYPVFTQSDPREDEALADCDVVLFELDSVLDDDNGIDIMWGDAGTGCFMIPRDRLKALDFSRVLYNFDCS